MTNHPNRETEQEEQAVSVSTIEGDTKSTPQDVAASSAKNESSLDFTDDTATQEKAVSPEVGRPYDPRPQEDGARRTIAYLLIALLWVVVSSVFILVAFGSIFVADIKEFAVILGPVVTLVSAATGFYYGTKSSNPTQN